MRICRFLWRRSGYVREKTNLGIKLRICDNVLYGDVGLDTTLKLQLATFTYVREATIT